MTLSASLASALSGLNAAARGAETVSNNIANAMTPGYGRRALTLAANTLGGAGQGVMVTGVLRDVDAVLLGDRRRAEAQEAADTAEAAAWRRIEAALGSESTGTSLAARVDRLDTALVTAAGRPDSEAYLEGVLDAAAGLVATIRGAGAAVQTARTAADRAIAADVALLNTSLDEVERINAQIRMIAASGRDPSALIDQRQAVIDRIAPIVPIRQVERPFGQIALFTPTGATLLDGRAVPIGFTGVGTVTATMTRAGGALSAVTQGGLTLEAGPGDPLAGGRLAANLALRDDGLPAAQAALDTLARDLVERFSEPAADPTLPAGAPGLFTDAGAAFNPALERGLAQRLAVNTLVDPAAGGALWRMRDGIGAPVPGPVGASTGLLRL
ncbi:MAG: FlgK family flagellar hook-associated protein, partial [Gemmobacter sp.]